MESERLLRAESQFRYGWLTVQDFVRAVAKSPLYRSLFFDAFPRYQFTELNFKHLLGRIPRDYAEIFHHSQILDNEGFEADIDSYIDSDEYMETFGLNIVPFWRGSQSQVGQNSLGFVSSNKFKDSYSISDRAIGSEADTSLTLMRQASSPYTRKSGDAEGLLWDLFNIGPSAKFISRTTQYQQNSNTTEFLNLKQECQEKDALIVKLRAQLEASRPAASIGMSVLGTWQPDSPSLSASIDASDADNLDGISYFDLKAYRDRQDNAIEELKSKISDAIRYEVMASSRLNRWRGRSF